MHTNRTLGVIFARRSSVSLDLLAEELYRLNSETPHDQWLDMLIVGSVGVVNYAVQFPGENISGDLLPPAEGALKGTPPAFYVVIVMRPTGEYSFNKLLAFLVAHLHFFSPDVAAQQLDSNKILDGVPNLAVTHLGFQANLSGELVPVPPEDYRGRILPQSPITLEQPSGTILSTIQFRKWQDGGIILLTGTLPLEGMLIFLKDVKSEYLRVIKRPTMQVSHVLPITSHQFNELLQNIQQRSNIIVNRQSGGYIMQKYLDEGTTNPFIARCTLGLLGIRENVFVDASKREAFDKIFQTTLSAVMSARTAHKEIQRLWTDHQKRVSSGEIANTDGRNIRILESVDKELGTEFETFINASARAIKTGLQGLCSRFGLDIGFLFKKPSNFKTGIDRVRKTDPDLANYLAAAREWTERLILLRNDLEHDIWEFPRVTYSINNATIVASEPKIVNESITVLVDFLSDRIKCFFEEITAHMLQRHMPAGIAVTEIPLHMRQSEAPERFQITLALGGATPWKIRYHSERFEDV
jgi:hypothetical protein